MLEVEMKFRVEDADAYEARVKSFLDAVFGEPSVECDAFFRCDALGFPNAGKMLRIRRRGSFLAVTYKGPRLDETTKTREEIELPLVVPGFDDSAIRKALVDRTRDDWARFFGRLGFQEAQSVEKTRRTALCEFKSRRFTITLDTLAELGVFTEIETLAPEGDLEEARDAVKELAEALGLRDTIVKSYLALAIEAQTGKSVDEK